MMFVMNRTVLLVEDEEQVLNLIVKVLEMRGYSVLHAESSLAALMLSDSHAGVIDLLLADVEIDETMSGIELAKVLRRARPGMRVLYTSGYPLDSCEDHGGNMVRKETQELLAEFLPKPFTPSVLVEKVRHAIEDMPV
jgi:two-component system cell cycle sensor histidine kinase/response regulator CckA